jgi:hypothetical protein
MAHLVLDQDHTLTGVHHGSIRVLKGSFVMVGTLYGTLELQATATRARGGLAEGRCGRRRGALVVVTGNLDGDVFIASGGRVVVDPGGRLKGAVDNSGLLTVRGTVEGLRRGTGEVRIERGGLVRGPAT